MDTSWCCLSMPPLALDSTDAAQRKKLSNVVRSATLLERAFERELQRNPTNALRFSKMFNTELALLRLVPAALKTTSA